MAKIKAEDVVFWIIILLIIAIAIWKVFGSPTDTATLITVTLFIAGSEILLWKAVFSLDKKTSCGFTKVKYELSEMRKDVDKRFDSLEKLITQRGRK